MRKAFAAVLLLCVLGGCREERLPLREEDGESEVQITLSFAPGPRSRSIYSGVGDGIDDICLWVFREGRLESYSYLEAGADAVLIGEALMRAPDKKQMLEQLRGVL